LIEFTAFGGAAGAAFIWPHGRLRMLTTLVKARLRLVAEGEATLLATPPPLVTDDFAPLLPKPEIVLLATACPPAPVPSMSVRLFVAREDAVVLDKTLHIYGDRPMGAAPAPFRSMPITYDRALGGPGTENPSGRGNFGLAPNVVDPTNAWTIAGFANIDARSPRRQRLVRGAPPRIDGWRLEGTENVPHAYYQTAPNDQLVSHLAGDEWVVLDGMHPTLARFRTQLPGLTVGARIAAPREVARPLQLTLDRVVIDMHRMQADLSYRGAVALEWTGPLSVVGGIATFEIEDAHSDTQITKPGVARGNNLASTWTEVVPPAVHTPVPAVHAAAPAVRSPVPAVHAAAPAVHAPTHVKPTPHAPPPAVAPVQPPAQQGKPTDLGATWTDAVPQPVQAKALPFKSVSRTLDGEVTLTSIQGLDLGLPFRSAPQANKPEKVPVARTFDVPRIADDSEDVEATATLMTSPALRAALPFGRSPGEPLPRVPEAHHAPDTARAPIVEPPPMPEAVQPAEAAPAAVMPSLVAPVSPASPPPPAVVLRAWPAPEEDHAPAAAVAPPMPPANVVAPAPAVALVDGGAPSPPPAPIAVPAEDRSGPSAIDSVTLTVAPVADAAPAETDPIRIKVLEAVAAKLPMRRLDLTNADLSGMELSGQDFSDAVLSGANLKRATLNQARFSNAKLQGADLSYASLQGADFTRAEVARANFCDANLEGAQLAHANATGTRFERAKLDGLKAAHGVFVTAVLNDASAQRAELRNADLSGAELNRARLNAADLVGARLSEARGESVVLDEADLSDASCTGVSFVDASLRGAKLARTQFDRSDLSRANFDRVSAPQAKFARARLELTSFLRADLPRCDFSGVSGEGAEFSEANLQGSDFRSAKLPDVRMQNAKLAELQAQKLFANGAHLDGADLTKAVLRGAKLKAADLVGARFDGTDLRDAELEGCRLDGADLSKAKVSGANLRGAT
jgi:uncharacterized protein YjbI with pentapeptide repeats